MLNVLTEKQVEEAVSKPLGTPTEVKRMKEWLDERVAKGGKTPYAEVVTLTPVLAALLIDINSGNRQIGNFNAEQIKTDILNGRFEFNGESIVISDSGILLDGQHRCHAVIETRTSIPAVLVFGPKVSARFTIDIGRPKSAANFLKMKGYTDSASLAAAVALIIQYNKTGTIPINFQRATKTEVVTAVDELRGVQASIDAVQSSAKMRLGSRSILGFCHYVFKKRAGIVAADEFINKLIDGDGLRKGDPIYHCRKRLIEMDSNARANSRCELIFRGWNAWRSGATVNPDKGIRLSGITPKLER